jgi:hypothetical protein
MYSLQYLILRFDIYIVFVLQHGGPGTVFAI